MKTYDVAIIGCGVAGMTAAIYLARSGISCCILEGNIPGGQIIDNGAIENYPGFKSISGSQLTLSILEQLKLLEVPIIYQKVTKLENYENKKIVLTTKEKIETKYVIIATGRYSRKLGFKEEEIYSGRGISYCAVCDGSLYKNKNVLVVGGSDGAFEAVNYLSHFAHKIILLHRRSEYRAQDVLIDKVKSLSNVEFKVGEVSSFITDKQKITGITLQTGEVVMCDGIFIYIGQLPNTEVFASLGICGENGYIKVDQSYQTSLDGIYAIGDCIAKKNYQIVIAMGEAANVALAITRR